MAEKFTLDMKILDALELHEGAAEVFESFGLPCQRCVVAEVETIEQGAHSKRLDAKEILEKLNSLFTKKEVPSSDQSLPTDKN